MKKVLKFIRKADWVSFLPLLFVLAFQFLPVAAFAADEASTMLNDTTTNILNFIGGAWVKTILIISLCASAIVYAVNKDNDKIKRNALAVGIAGGILMVASALVGVVYTK